MTLDLLRIHPGAFAVMMGIVGLLFGSFLNVVIYRLPVMVQRELRRDARDVLDLELEIQPRFNLAVPNSRCPCCDRAIRPWENLPVLSWLALRGRCSGCQAKISVRYPLIELATGLLSFITAWHFGYGPQCLFALVMVWGGIALFMIDIDTMLLPDCIVLPGIWLGMVSAYFSIFSSLDNALIGACVGYLAFAIPACVFSLITGRSGMGAGDFKLLALFGAWLGWQALPIIVLLSAVSGAIIGLITVRRGGEPYPFGPFIIVAGFLAMFYGHEIYAMCSHSTGVAIGAKFFD
ncbi:prepilin peptidase [Pseudomonas violetae]|nr:A24 family peptidase [Pseudomonas violetae]